MAKSKWDVIGPVLMAASCVIGLAKSIVDSKRQEEQIEEQIEEAVEKRLQELEK